MREPSLPETPKPPTTRLPCAMRVHLAIGAAQRRHDQTTAAQAAGVADRGDTVTSMVLARLGERRQVGVHGHRGHVLELRIGVGRNGDAVTRSSMFLMLWIVNGAWLVWSPVPSRPTTRP